MLASLPTAPGPIGLFDSGYGGLTIFRDIRRELPQYDYIYLGDNARAPYGSRSFDVIYRYTLEAVRELFSRGCHLVILACNTASAKALRTIQQRDLPELDPARRVLGIIHPTVEAVGGMTRTGHVGVLGTQGTIQSGSYGIEIRKLFPTLTVVGEACPMWVPLVENSEYDKPGADYFVNYHIKSIMQRDPAIDTLILACTHYPLLLDKISAATPPQVVLMPQGEYVAKSLRRYLERHPEMEVKCTRGGTESFFTTESAEKFSEAAHTFLNRAITVSHIVLDGEANV